MELHWLPIEQRINFKILLITFKALHNQAPTYLTDYLLSTSKITSLIRKKLAFESYL